MIVPTLRGNRLPYVNRIISIKCASRDQICNGYCGLMSPLGYKNMYTVVVDALEG